MAFAKDLPTVGILRASLGLVRIPRTGMVHMTNSPEPTEPADADVAESGPETGETTATTAEEAMDADSNADGHADESAYAPTESPANP